MNNIKINFINMSDDISAPPIVIALVGGINNGMHTAVVWKIINDCGHYCHYPFLFSTNYHLQAICENGHKTLMAEASPGSRYILGAEGNEATLSLLPPKPVIDREIEVSSAMPTNNYSINLLKDGKLISQRKNIAPGETINFRTSNNLLITTKEGYNEGDIVLLEDIEKYFERIDLTGIRVSDVILTGGGVKDKKKQKFRFKLEHVVRTT